MARVEVVCALALAGLVLAGGPAIAGNTPACDNGLGNCELQNPVFGGQDYLDVFQWVYRESIPVGVTRTAAVATPDGNIHVICGNTMQPETSYAREQIYFPEQDTWVIGDLVHPAGSNHGVHNHDAKCIGNKIWVGGGSSVSGYYSNLTMIDLEANTWTEIGAMPVTDMMYYEFCAGSDGKLYMFGDDLFANATFVFDTTTRTWTSRAAMPEGLASPAAACVGDTIYLFGGENSSSVPVNSTRAYSISGNSWTTKTSAPTARYWHTANVVAADSGPMIYVCGGIDASGSPVATVERYNVTTGTWATMAPLQQFRRSHGGVTVGDSVFVVAGWHASRPTPFMRSLERGYDSLPSVGTSEREIGCRPTNALSAVPNPCRGQTIINPDGGLRKAELVGVYDATGKRVRTMTVSGRTLLSTCDLTSGVYWLRPDRQARKPLKLVVEQ